jgi:hypothetical protein
MDAIPAPVERQRYRLAIVPSTRSRAGARAPLHVMPA